MLYLTERVSSAAYIETVVSRAVKEQIGAEYETFAKGIVHVK